MSRAHEALKAAALTKCANCGALRRPHHMCLACGFYRGRQVLDLAAKNAKRTKRMNDKKEQIRAQSSTPETTEPKGGDEQK